MGSGHYTTWVASGRLTPPPVASPPPALIARAKPALYLYPFWVLLPSYASSLPFLHPLVPGPPGPAPLRGLGQLGPPLDRRDVASLMGQALGGAAGQAVAFQPFVFSDVFQVGVALYHIIYYFIYICSRWASHCIIFFIILYMCSRWVSFLIMRATVVVVGG